MTSSTQSDAVPFQPNGRGLGRLPSSIRGLTKAALPNVKHSAQIIDGAYANVGFRYVWPVRVSLRQLGSNGENTILHISPKFSTVHEHVSFQWTLKMYGTSEMADEEEANEEEEESDKKAKGTKEVEADEHEHDDEDGNYSSAEKGYVAISLYYLDGPVSNVELKAQVRIAGQRRDSDEKQSFLEGRNTVSVCRGHECELSFEDRAHLTGYIRQKIGHLIRLSLLLELDAGLFRADTYLNAVSPTPYHSFLTANYRARVGSKIWRKRRSRSASDGQALSGHKKMDLERMFNRMMVEWEGEENPWGSSSRKASSSRKHSLISKGEAIGDDALKEVEVRHSDDNLVHEIESSKLLCAPSNCHRRQHNSLSPTPPSANVGHPPAPHLFKKLLVACCDSCERRASLMSMTTDDEKEENEEEKEVDVEKDKEEHSDGDDVVNTFECDEENKAEIHDTLANMYFNRVVLPELEYVEDFVDFLIDAELSDLPVLKRACERYLCGELDSKKELMTSLILDFFFISILFQLPVMKSMTLTELCERYSELEDVTKLLEHEEYQNIDKRIRQLCGDRNLHDLLDECKRFREQCLRVQKVDLSKNGSNLAVDEVRRDGKEEELAIEQEEEDEGREEPVGRKKEAKEEEEEEEEQLLMKKNRKSNGAGGLEELPKEKTDEADLKMPRRKEGYEEAASVDEKEEQMKKKDVEETEEYSVDDGREGGNELKEKGEEAEPNKDDLLKADRKESAEVHSTTVNGFDSSLQ